MMSYYYLLSDGGDGPVSTAIEADSDDDARAASYDPAYHDRGDTAVEEVEGVPSLLGMSEAEWTAALEAAGLTLVGPHHDQDPPDLAGGRQVWRAAAPAATAATADIIAAIAATLAGVRWMWVDVPGGVAAAALQKEEDHYRDEEQWDPIVEFAHARALEHFRCEGSLAAEIKQGLHDPYLSCPVGCDALDQWVGEPTYGRLEEPGVDSAEEVVAACRERAPRDPDGAPEYCQGPVSGNHYPTHEWVGSRCRYCGWGGE